MRAAGILCLLLAGLLAAASLPRSEAAAHEEPGAGAVQGPPVIAALREKGARIVALGERGGLDGHFVELADGDAYGLYVTADGHAVAGLLYAPDGTLLTGGQIAAAEDRGAGTETRAARPAAAAARTDGVAASAGSHAGPARLAHAIADDRYAPNTEALFERSASAFGFTLGRTGPQVVLFADPGCRWSRSAVARLGGPALSGRLRLRVVPVGVLGAASAREAASIAGATDTALAWFEGTHTPGGPEGGRRIARNNTLFEEWGGRAVPLIAWRAPDGRIAHRLGDVDDIDAWLEALPHE